MTRGVSVVILRGQSVPLGYSNFVPTPSAAVNAGVGYCIAWGVDCIEITMRAALQRVCVLIQSHSLSPFSARKRRARYPLRLVVAPLGGWPAQRDHVGHKGLCALRGRCAALPEVALLLRDFERRGQDGCRRVVLGLASRR